MGNKALALQTGINEGTNGLGVIITDKLVDVLVIVARTVILSSQSGYGTTIGNGYHTRFIHFDETLHKAFEALIGYGHVLGRDNT